MWLERLDLENGAENTFYETITNKVFHRRFMKSFEQKIAIQMTAVKVVIQMVWKWIAKGCDISQQMLEIVGYVRILKFAIFLLLFFTKERRVNHLTVITMSEFFHFEFDRAYKCLF